MFINRLDAALQLAERLKKYKDTKTVVLALPRGGVPVGYEIARELNLPLDIVMSKKIGHPSNKEFAIGSVNLENIYINPRTSFLSQEYIDQETKRIREEIQKKQKLFMENREPINIENKTVIIVDDGIATGSTMFATIDLVKLSNPQKIIVAIPIGPLDTINRIEKIVDEVICLDTPENIVSVGQYYEDFDQVTDEEVRQYLKKENNVEKTN